VAKAHIHARESVGQRQLRNVLRQHLPLEGYGTRNVETLLKRTAAAAYHGTLALLLGSG